MSTHSFDDSGGKYGYDPRSNETGDFKRRGMVTSMVSKVVKPPPRESRHHYRSRSFSPERTLKRSPVSRAEVKIWSINFERQIINHCQIPPRPSRSSGRDERGGDRTVSRAMVDADRSLKGRDRDRERYADPVLRLSRYEFLQRKRELSDLSLQVGLIFIFLTLFQTLNFLSPPP